MSTDARIRPAIADTTKGEAARTTLPARVRDLALGTVDDVLGRRDPGSPGRGVLLVPRPVRGVRRITGLGLERAAAAECLLLMDSTIPPPSGSS